MNQKNLVEGSLSSRVSLLKRRPSNAWYLVPILLDVSDGIIMYLVLKDKDPVMAKKGLHWNYNNNNSNNHECCLQHLGHVVVVHLNPIPIFFYFDLHEFFESE